MAGRITTTVALDQPQSANGMVIQNNAELVDSNGNQLQQKSKMALVTVQHEFVDEHGEHYFQVGNDTFILKNSVTLDPLLWQDAMKNGDEPFSLNAENINQIWWGMPNGCEPAALLTGLHLQGHALDLDYLTFLKQMPRASDYNPYHGFGGEPDQDVPGHFEAIFPAPLVKWASQYAVVRDLSGTKAEALQQSLQQKKPVLAYVTVGFETPKWGQYSFGTALSNNHAVLVDGYFGQLLHVSDPIDGRYWLSLARFKQAYDARRWAVEIN